MKFTLPYLNGLKAVKVISFLATCLRLKRAWSEVVEAACGKIIKYWIF